MRAMSLRVLRSRLGFSSFSVTAWVRRSKRCFWRSFISSSIAAVCLSRISLLFMTFSFLLKEAGETPAVQLCHRMLAGNKSAANRHFVGHARQGALGGLFIDAGNFENHVAGLDDGHPVFRLAFALAHAGFQRLTADRLMRENPDEHAAFAGEIVAARHAAGLDLPRGYPGHFQCLKAIFAKGNRIAASGVALHLATLAFSEFDPLGH